MSAVSLLVTSWPIRQFTAVPITVWPHVVYLAKSWGNEYFSRTGCVNVVWSEVDHSGPGGTLYYAVYWGSSDNGRQPAPRPPRVRDQYPPSFPSVDQVSHSAYHAVLAQDVHLSAGLLVSQSLQAVHSLSVSILSSCSYTIYAEWQVPIPHPSSKTHETAFRYSSSSRM